MLRSLLKLSSVVLFLLLLSTQFVRAETKLYQYDGKLPFVQMMLNMMVAMGILDRLPANAAYGGYGRSAYPSSLWSSLINPYAKNNPYLRALAMRGITPGSSSFPMQNMYGNNPFVRSPWLQSPWSQSALNYPDAAGISPLWGSPSWGVLPYNSYTENSYSPYAYAGDGVSDLSGWVNEPWEESAWNSRTGYYDKNYPRQHDAYRENTASTASTTVPLVQNFNYNVPENKPQSNGLNDKLNHNTAESRSPLARLVRPDARQSDINQSRSLPSRQGEAAPQQRPSPLHKRYKARHAPVQKACVTEFCGLKIPDLNGLWVAQSGEMLGIKNHRYLWSDGDSRYLTGQLKIQNEYLLANVDGHEQVMRFKYKLAGNRLLTMQPDGVIREFVRMPRGQLQQQYRNY